MRKYFLFFCGILFLLLLLHSAGCRHTGRWLAKEEVPSHADAIVLLMGYYPERVLQATDLYHQGVADDLIIVYENMGPYQVLEARGASVIRTTEQARDAAVSLGIPDSCITMLPGDARSTLDEAVAVRAYMADKPWLDTLLLVSSPAHMRRSYIIFRTVLHKSGINAYIGTGPSYYSSFNPDKWWRRREDVQTVLSEWVKLLAFTMFEKGKIE
jgi:uncharacterized SAM-binding protein YcdF (DUF218 family)